MRGRRGEGGSGRGLRGGGEWKRVVRVNGSRGEGGEGGEGIEVWVNGSRANSCCCLEGLLFISFLETCSLWVEVTLCGSERDSHVTRTSYKIPSGHLAIQSTFCSCMCTFDLVLQVSNDSNSLMKNHQLGLCLFTLKIFVTYFT